MKGLECQEQYPHVPTKVSTGISGENQNPSVAADWTWGSPVRLNVAAKKKKDIWKHG